MERERSISWSEQEPPKNPSSEESPKCQQPNQSPQQAQILPLLNPNPALHPNLSQTTLTVPIQEPSRKNPNMIHSSEPLVVTSHVSHPSPKSQVVIQKTSYRDVLCPN